MSLFSTEYIKVTEKIVVMVDMRYISPKEGCTLSVRKRKELRSKIVQQLQKNVTSYVTKNFVKLGKDQTKTAPKNVKNKKKLFEEDVGLWYKGHFQKHSGISTTCLLPAGALGIGSKRQAYDIFAEKLIISYNESGSMSLSENGRRTRSKAQPEVSSYFNEMSHKSIPKTCKQDTLKKIAENASMKRKRKKKTSALPDLTPNCPAAPVRNQSNIHCAQRTTDTGEPCLKRSRTSIGDEACDRKKLANEKFMESFNRNITTKKSTQAVMVQSSLEDLKSSETRTVKRRKIRLTRHASNERKGNITESECQVNLNNVDNAGQHYNLGNPSGDEDNADDLPDLDNADDLPDLDNADDLPDLDNADDLPDLDNAGRREKRSQLSKSILRRTSLLFSKIQNSSSEDKDGPDECDTDAKAIIATQELDISLASRMQRKRRKFIQEKSSNEASCKPSKEPNISYFELDSDESPDLGPSMEEIHLNKSVRDLTRSQLEFLVKKNEIYLRRIFQGKERCRRHEDYKAGGKRRFNLQYQLPVGDFTDAQNDIVAGLVVSFFCKKDLRYFNYTLRVLLPEALIKVYMEVHQVDHEEAEIGLARIHGGFQLREWNFDDGIDTLT